MPEPLPLMVKGQFPSLLDTETANLFRAAIEGIRNATVAPSGFGKVVSGEKDTTIDLSPLADQINKLQQSVNAILQTGGGGGDGGGGGGGGGNPPGCCSSNTTSIQNITERLNNAGVTGACNGDGTITITLHI